MDTVVLRRRGVVPLSDRPLQAAGYTLGFAGMAAGFVISGWPAALLMAGWPIAAGATATGAPS
ncbi:hypothetical protein GCM10009527_004910 [Actinomadura nitritigenes]|uniref:Uncharacterized protein n=1 Tax=Actinomadura nitritigenes TaxID=134602 RepID=A0ABS3REV8_9ACTN|nr:hypothetical protein [Actinomadura nitritigenes]MBO2444635.1 hypothetical protein [Actinomadura nitritigenes]